MTPESPTPTSGKPHRDRTGRLTLFGALSIVVGTAGVLLGIAQLAVPLLTRRLGATYSADARSQLMGVVLYALLGAAFIVVGIGSVRRRRWVRSLMLILAWTWLLGGLLVIPFLPGLLDGLLGAGLAGDPATLPAATPALVKAVVLSIAAFAGIVLPALFVWVYQDRDLLLTCEAWDVAPSWTDRCPLAVLGLSLGLGVFSALAATTALRPVVPWFGRLVTGWPGSLLALAGALLCAYLAWSTFKLRNHGWWGSTALLVAIGVSTLWTLIRVELAEFYRAMGYPEQQLALLERSGAMNGPVTFWLTALMTVLTVVYMAGIRRHFRRR